MDSSGSERASLYIMIAYVDGNFVIKRDIIIFQRNMPFVPRIIAQPLIKCKCFINFLTTMCEPYGMD